MCNKLFRFAAGVVLATGMLMAQAPEGSQPAQPPASTRATRRAQRFDRLATKLNLTADQRQQTQAIFEASRQSAKPLFQQLRQDRQSLRAAVESGKSDAEIGEISANIGNLKGQLTAVHSKAFAKVYALLTPEQRTQAQALFQHRRAQFMHRHAPAAGAAVEPAHTSF